MNPPNFRIQQLRLQDREQHFHLVLCTMYHAFYLELYLAISFFIACSALDDDNLQLPQAVSILPNDDRPPDRSLDYHKNLIDENDNNNNNNGVNLSPFIFDQAWITPFGDANAGEAYAAAAAAAAEDLDSHTSSPFNRNAVNVVAAGGCHVSEVAVKGEKGRETGPALLCPVLPAQNTPEPPTAATEEDKNRVMIIEEDNKIREPTPPLSSAENKFDWNDEICPPDIYGALRQVPVCHSGNSVLKIFDSLLRSWKLWDIRPCKLNFFPQINIYIKEKRKREREKKKKKKKKQHAQLLMHDGGGRGVEGVFF